jgi:hypothetical protein
MSQTEYQLPEGAVMGRRVGSQYPITEAIDALRAAIVAQTGLIKRLAERLGEIERLHKADFNFRGVILDQFQYDAISNQLRPQRPAKRKKGRK